MLIKRVIVELARVLLSFTLLLSAFLKAIDPVGFGIKLEEYFEAIAHIHIANSFIVLLLSLTIISFEFLLGSCLVMGIYRRLSARLTFLLMLFMTLLTAYNYSFEAVSDCGCFGEAIKLSNGATFLKNLFLLPLSYFVMRVARQIKPLYTIRERVILLLLSFGCIAFFMKQNISKLPWIDFRPYKVGYNLKEQIQAEQDSLQNKLLASTQYIYSKNGKEGAFTSNNLPDSTWTFIAVKQDERLAELEQKYNFAIFNNEGEAVQEKLLNSPKLNVLLLSPSWADAPQDKVDEINNLYHLTKKQGNAFYAISASNEEQAKKWLYETGADYPIYTMDKTTIKTIIRSSLGLVFIKDGIILDKLSYEQLPSEREALSQFLTKKRNLPEISKKSNDFRLIPLIIWLIFLIFGFGRRLLRHSFAFAYLRRKL